MKLKRLIAMVILATAHVSFGQTKMFRGPFDVVAPVLPSEPDLVNRQAGQIFYDIGEGLKVVNPEGGIDTITSSGVDPIVTGGTNIRIESADVAAPSAGACVVSNETSDWIAGNATSSGTGVCTITFNGTPFASAPSCFLTARAIGNRIINITTGPSTGGFTMLGSLDSGNVLDVAFSVLCIGAR